jgi:hypothetical protein
MVTPTKSLSRSNNLILWIFLLTLAIGGFQQLYEYTVQDTHKGVVQSAQISHEPHNFDTIAYTIKLDNGQTIRFIETCVVGRYVDDCNKTEERKLGARVTLVEDPLGTYAISNNAKISEYIALTTGSIVFFFVNLYAWIRKGHVAR